MGRFSRLFLITGLLVATLPVFAQEPEAGTNTTTLHVPPPSETATAPELELQGDQYRAQKSYLDSIDYYRAALRKDDTAILHNKIGISLLLLQRHAEAKKEFEHAIKLDKTYPEAYNNLGALFYNARRYGSAVKEYKKAIRLADENASFHS